MYRPSRVQKNVGIGRFVSLVRGFAALKGSSVFFTQMLRVPCSGFMNAMYLPSGEISAPVISGSPKSSSRSMIGGCCATAGSVSAHSDRSSVYGVRRIWGLTCEDDCVAVRMPRSTGPGGWRRFQENQFAVLPVEDDVELLDLRFRQRDFASEPYRDGVVVVIQLGDELHVPVPAFERIVAIRDARVRL